MSSQNWFCTGSDPAHGLELLSSQNWFCTELDPAHGLELLSSQNWLCTESDPAHGLQLLNSPVGQRAFAFDLYIFKNWLEPIIFGRPEWTMECDHRERFVGLKRERQTCGGTCDQASDVVFLVHEWTLSNMTVST